jgi:hypothetical protein
VGNWAGLAVAAGTAGQSYQATPVTGGTYTSPSGVVYNGGTATGGIWSPDTPGSTPQTPLMPDSGSAQNGYNFNLTTPGSPNNAGSNNAANSTAPDWNKMLQDAQTMRNLVYGPGGGTPDAIQKAVEIALSYSQYMRADWGIADRILSESQAYKNGTATQGQLNDLFWLLGSHNPDAMTWMAQHPENWFPGEVWIDPEIAIGYNYTASVPMRTVMIPKALPRGQTTFDLVVNGKTFPLEAGKRFFFTSEFPNGVDAFTIKGIDVAEQLDASNMNAFVTGISFMKEGVPGTAVSMTPIVKRSFWTSTGFVIFGSMSAALALAGAFVAGLAYRRKHETA